MQHEGIVFAQADARDAPECPAAASHGLLETAVLGGECLVEHMRFNFGSLTALCVTYHLTSKRRSVYGFEVVCGLVL